MTARILLLGANGQLGSEIARQSAARGIPIDALGRAELDATSREDVLRAAEEKRPTIVVNCAAYTNVDKAEDEPAVCFAANATAARNAALAATKAGARLLHMSTSYVFDGAKVGPYDESDVPAPLGTYSTSKLAGEALVRAFAPHATIVRLVSVYGLAGAKAKESGNFVEAFAKRIRAGQDLRVVADQWITPSNTEDLAAGVLDLAALPHLPPIVNLANEGRCSWYDAAAYVREKMGGDAKVAPIPASEWPHYKSPRPPNSTMSTRLFTSLTGRKLPPWQDSLDRYLKAKGYA